MSESWQQTTKEKFVPVLESKRIGLSATPERWFDDEGTDFVKNIIGDVVYEYTMEMAIEGKSFVNIITILFCQSLMTMNA